MLVNYFFCKSNLSKYPRCAGIRVLSSATKQPSKPILHPTNSYKLADKKLESLLQSWEVEQLQGNSPRAGLIRQGANLREIKAAELFQEFTARDLKHATETGNPN